MIAIPLRTGCGLNAREHPMARARRVKAERWATTMVLLSARPAYIVPGCVRLTRVAPSKGLDDDQVVGALKAPRDAVAAWLGIDDKDPRMQYAYAQRRGPWGISIEFGAPMAAAVFVAVGP